jgi:4-hydroxy-tetrahydrodipicolinate synthase
VEETIRADRDADPRAESPGPGTQFHYPSGMADDHTLRGVHIPLITPGLADGSVDLESLERIAHQYLDAGAAGLVPLGTTGESAALDGAEKQSVIDLCARICTDRDAKLIVGVGTNSTRSTIAGVQSLAAVPGVTAALVVVPYYVRPGEAGVVEHFRAVAAASPVPIVLYNIPVRTGQALGAKSVLEIAALPNVIGMKQATAGLDVDTLAILAGMPDGFAVLGGEDPFLFPLVLMGGHGAICASAHVLTERFIAMIECGLAQKVDDGRGHAEALLPVVRACFAEPNPSVFKGVLHAQGRISSPTVRLPLVDASAGAVQAALAAIDAAS